VARHDTVLALGEVPECLVVGHGPPSNSAPVTATSLTPPSVAHVVRSCLMT
jgi:hypothetical protein